MQYFESATVNFNIQKVYTSPRTTHVSITKNIIYNSLKTSVSYIFRRFLDFRILALIYSIYCIYIYIYIYNSVVKMGARKRWAIKGREIVRGKPLTLGTKEGYPVGRERSLDQDSGKVSV